jgi:hypothetical protein
MSLCRWVSLEKDTITARWQLTPVSIRFCRDWSCDVKPSGLAPVRVANSCSLHARAS